MGAASVAVDVLLACGLAGVLLCVLGALIARTTFDRLHFAAAATTVPAFLVLAAVVVREHVSSGGLEAIAAVGLLFLLNPALLVLTARAAGRTDRQTLASLPEEGE